MQRNRNFWRWRGAALAVTLLVSVCASAQAFKLSASELPAGKAISQAFVYNRSGCTGNDRSPALSWSAAPAGTRSFVVTVHDPDAVGGWWHWAVVNIPASVHHLDEQAGAAGGRNLPASAVQLVNDFGDSAYDGPCPPPGDAPHHYHFRIYALDVSHLSLKASDSPDRLQRLLRQHSLGMAQIVRRYGR